MREAEAPDAGRDARPVQVAVTGGVAVLAGIAAWGTQQGRPGERPEPQGEVAAGVTPAQLPPVIAHFTGSTTRATPSRCGRCCRRSAAAPSW